MFLSILALIYEIIAFCVFGASVCIAVSELRLKRGVRWYEYPISFLGAVIVGACWPIFGILAITESKKY
jgi:hypothetical protein